MPFDEGWRVEVKVRITGTSLGTSDAVSGGWLAAVLPPDALALRLRVAIPRRAAGG